MSDDLIIDIETDKDIVRNYFKNLVNHFFKILPMWENGEKTLSSYIESLQYEMVGCKEVVKYFDCDYYFITLISILQYLKDTPDCSVTKVKREVFKAISICNRLAYCFEEQGGVMQ